MPQNLHVNNLLEGLIFIKTIGRIFAYNCIMKKSTILFMGILLGSIFVSRPLFSHSDLLPEEDPSGVEQTISEVKVFPNPSDGRFQLTFEYSGQEKLKAKVFDITGKMVEDISEDLVKSERSVSANVDLASPGSGIYFVRISAGKSLLTKKIIIR